MADPDKVEVVNKEPVKVAVVDGAGAEIPPKDKPTVESVKTTSETVTTKGDPAAISLPIAPPAPDDYIRKVTVGVDMGAFVLLVGGICAYLMYRQNSVGTDVMAVLIMVVQAMIGVITIERNYLFGSSSGSTLKTAQGK